MTKEESLAFLQSCLEDIENATEDDIQFYKDLYEKEFNSSNKNSVSNG